MKYLRCWEKEEKMEIIIHRQDGKEEAINISKEGVEARIDTNIFINLFESAESLNYLKEKGYTIYTHPKCLWEMVKYVKTLDLKDKNTEEVVRNFMRRNGIFLTYEEVNKDEIEFFEKRCKKAGINCHYPDSEFILACQKPWVFDHCQNSTSGILKFKKQGVEKVYSQDLNFRKAAEFAGMKAEKFVFEN